LQWFCAEITNKLNLEDRVADYWKQGMGSKQKCGNYFQRYLLATITTPLTLGLDEVDRVFPYPQVAQVFLVYCGRGLKKEKTNQLGKNCV
jgi:hypothetical protein